MQSFEPYSYQSDILADEADRILVLKARQVGLSRTASILLAHSALHKPRNVALVVSRDQNAASNVLSMVYEILDNLDDRPTFERRGVYECMLANGARIVSQPATPKAGRSLTANQVFLDEFAFADYDTEIYRSVLPTLSRGGQLVVLSTPNGMDNMFYHLWAGDEGGEWSKHRIHWSDCPVYTAAWAEKERTKYSAAAWASEYECDFVESGAALFKREWFDIIDAVPAGLQTIRFWDLAATDAKDAHDPDWTAGARMGIDEDGIVYVLDLVRRRSNPSETEAMMRQTAELDGRDVSIYFEQEPGASGKAYLDYLRRKIFAGFSTNVLTASVRGSKISLASPLSAQAEVGNIRLLRGAWNQDFLDEAERFPLGKHDDQVDAAASAYYVLTDSAWLMKTPHRRVMANLLQELTSRMAECSRCHGPLYYMAGQASVICQQCGQENRKEPDVVPVA